MNLEALANDLFVLLKKNGDRVRFKGLFHRGSITSFDSALQVDSVFLVERGDIVERIMPADKVKRYLVHIAVFNAIGPSHVIYTIKIERMSAHPNQIS